MMLRYFQFIALAVVAAALTLPVAQAQDFEGVLKHRYVELDREAVMNLLGGTEREAAETARYLADRPFEQILRATGARARSHVSYLKGDFISVHPDSGAQYLLVDTRTGTIRKVNTDRKTYTELSEDAFVTGSRTAAGSIAHMGIDKLEPDAWEDDSRPHRFISKRTGTETELNGFPVSLYEYVGSEQVVIGWCALDTTGYAQSASSMAMRRWLDGDRKDDAATTVCPADLLPVRTLTYRDNPLQLRIREVLFLRRESLADDRFRVPAGYVSVTAATDRANGH